jgi:hypothetical protein
VFDPFEQYVNIKNGPVYVYVGDGDGTFAVDLDRTGYGRPACPAVAPSEGGCLGAFGMISQKLLRLRCGPRINVKLPWHRSSR